MTVTIPKAILNEEQNNGSFDRFGESLFHAFYDSDLYLLLFCNTEKEYFGAQTDEAIQKTDDPDVWAFDQCQSGIVSGHAGYPGLRALPV